MAGPIPEDIRHPGGAEALRLLPDVALREMQARAVAIQHLSTRLHDGDGFQREEGDDLYLSLVWLSEGLVDRVMELGHRWSERTTGKTGDDILADLDAEVRRFRKEADAFNTLDTEEQGNPLMEKAEALVRRMAATPASRPRGALLLLAYLEEFREIGLAEPALASIRRVLGDEAS